MELKHANIQVSSSVWERGFFNESLVSLSFFNESLVSLSFERDCLSRLCLKETTEIGTREWN